MKPFHLTPTMVSRKTHALRFIRDYWREHHASPSLGEIGAALRVTRQHARDIVKQLAADGSIKRRSGPRGISLLAEDEAALRTLRDLGWTVDPKMRRVEKPLSLSEIALLGFPLLDHDADTGDGSGHGETGKGAPGGAG